MTIAEQAAKYHVSRKLITKMIKSGDFKRQGKSDVAAYIRARLLSDEQLSVRQLLALIHSPQLFRELGKFSESARDQVVELGSVKAAAAPNNVADHLRGAADGNVESVEVVMRWLKGILPQWPVRHHWVACRLLTGSWPNLRRTHFTCAFMALKNVRAHPGFDGWSSPRHVGTQNPTCYHRPRPPFDL